MTNQKYPDYKEPEYIKITFNFFKNEYGGSFKFCRPYEFRTDVILRLVEMTPQERLSYLQEFLDYGKKGKSCEFHWQGEFYPCKEIDEEKLELRKESMMRAIQSRSKAKNLHHQF